MSKEQWSAVIRTNLDSLFNMTRPVIEGMRTRGWGRVIVISTLSINGGQYMM
jgi:acetoacetyl-CoA reductase